MKELNPGNYNFYIAIFVCVAVFLLPFNNIPVAHKLLGEFSREASFYPTFFVALGFLIILLKNKLIFPSVIPFYILIFFFMLTLGGAVLNLPTILQSELQGRTGLGRFFSQEAVLSWGILIVVTTYNCVETYIFPRLFRFSVLVMLLLLSAYVFLELRCIFGYSYGHHLLAIEKYINASPGLSFRVRGFSTEPSWFAIYLAFAYPVFYLSVIYSKGRSRILWNLLNLYAVVVFVMLYSRTAMLVFLAVVLSVTGLLLKFKASRGSFHYPLFVGLLSLAVYLGGNYLLYSKPNEHPGAAGILEIKNVAAKNQRNIAAFNHSNQTRLSGAISAINIGLQNPVVGVGMGQYAFYASKYVPQALKDNNEELRHYLVENAAWPVAYMVFARVFAETGVIGLLTWIALWGTTILLSIKRLLSGGDVYTGVLLVSTGVALCLTGLSQDSYRFLGYWIFFGISFAYLGLNLNLSTYD